MAAADGAQTRVQGRGPAGHRLTFAARAQATAWTRTGGKIAKFLNRTRFSTRVTILLHLIDESSRSDTVIEGVGDHCCFPEHDTFAGTEP